MKNKYKLTNEQFLERLKQRNPNILEKIEILEEYKGANIKIKCKIIQTDQIFYKCPSDLYFLNSIDYYIEMNVYINELKYYWESWNSCDFSKIFNLTFDEFTNIYKKAQRSYLNIAIELFIQGKTIKEISKQLKIDRNTVKSYLKRAKELGLCNK